MKNLSSYFTEDGFVGHRTEAGALEFGDGAQRVGFLGVAAYPADPGKTMIATMSCLAWSEPVRYPDRWQWYGRPGTMSWDNWFPLFCNLALRDPEEAKKQFWRVVKRGCFMWNTKKIGQWDDGKKIPDWAGPIPLIGKPSTFSVAARLYMDPKRPFAFTAASALADAFDVLLAVTSLFKIIASRVSPTRTTDDLNHLVALRTCQLLYKTRLLRLSAWLYVRFRGLAQGPKGEVYAAENGPQSALDQYFDGESNPPLNEVWRQPIRDLL